MRRCSVIVSLHHTDGDFIVTDFCGFTATGNQVGVAHYVKVGVAHHVTSGCGSLCS